MAEKRTIELEVKESGFKSLKAQLREAQADVAALSDKFGATSDQAIAAARSAAILKDKIGDAKTLTDAFNPDAKFKALTGSLSGAANGFQAVQGAMGLVGVESAAVEETLLRVQSAMAFAQGIDGLLESIDSFKTLAKMLGIVKTAKVVDTAVTATQATVTNVASVATGKMTIAQRLLNLVMKANPVLLLVAGISALAGAYIYLTIAEDENIKKEKEKQEQIKKTLELTKKSQDYLGKQFDSQNEKTQNNIDLLKAKGATDKEIYEAERDLMSQQLRQMNLQRQSGIKLTKEQYDSYKKIVHQREVLDAEYANDKADKEKENAEKRKQNQEKNNADYLKRQQDDNEKLKKAEANLATELLKISQDWEEKQKAAREKRIEDAKTAEQDVYDNAIGYLEAAIIADENNLQAKKDLLDVQRNLELQNAELTGGEVAAINAKYDKEIADAEIANAKAVAEQKAAIQMQGLDVALQGVQLIKGVFEQQKGIQKAAVIAESAIGIAKMIIANKLANVAALATPQAIATSGAAAVPVIALNNISTGIGIAANIAATGKALKTLGGGTAPTAPPVGGGGGGAGGVSAPNFNIVGNSGINQLAELGGQPIQAYVVSGEVTSAQALDRNRVQNATF